jgi:H+/Cl- antiporter ClcA
VRQRLERLARNREDAAMNPAKLIGIILIVAGALGLTYGGFTYTKDTQSARLGPLVLQVQEKETVYVPIVLSAGAIALGLFLLVGLRTK